MLIASHVDDILSFVLSAIEDKNLDDLPRLIAEATAGGMEGEKSVQYAIRMLQTFRNEQQQREDDEKIYNQAYLVKQEEDDKNWRLEKEYMELQEKVFTNSHYRVMFSIGLVVVSYINSECILQFVVVVKNFLHRVVAVVLIS